MNMFSYKDFAASFVRFFIFMMILAGYPMLHFLGVNLIQDLFFGRNVSRTKVIVIGATLNVTGLLFTIFYPNVGAVLAYFGSVSGLICIYTMPVLVHLSLMKQKIENQIAGHTEFEPAVDI